MSRVLVAAGMGMLGHALVRALRAHHSVGATVRDPSPVAPYPLDGVRVFAGVDLRDRAAAEAVLDAERWDVAVNAAGVVKQRPEAADPAQTIAVNALLPHELAAACGARGIRLIHFSTDCVFSGSPESQRGPDGYRESDPADARDRYGLSKYLGEPSGPHCLTLRTSLIGHELRGHHGLLGWFLRQPDSQVRGFTRALFTGLTTGAAAGLADLLIRRRPALAGLWHVAAEPISKHDLLLLFRRRFSRTVEIQPDASFACDRRLDGGAFRAAAGWTAPPWPAMIEGLGNAP